MNISLHYDRKYNADDACSKILNSVHQKSLTSAINRAFESPYELTIEQYDHLRNAIAPRLLNIKQTATTHPHPVPACLQIMAYQKCIDHSRHFKNVIDIGGNNLRTPPNHHICSLISTSREKARYMNAAFCVMQGGDISSMNNHNKGVLLNNSLACTRGADKCSYKAQYAYMINVYDIPIEQIPLIMTKHNIQVLDAWMFLPNSLIDYKMRTDETFYTTNIYRRKGQYGQRILFNFGCSSTNYEHDYINLRKYATTTYIKHPGGGIYVEHIEQYHTFTRIRFTWTNISEPLYTPGVCKTIKDFLDGVIGYNNHAFYARTIRLKGAEDYAVVPDLVAQLKTGFEVAELSEYTIYIKNSVVEDANNYAQRQADTSFNYPSFCSYIQSRMTGLVYLNNGSKQFIYKTTKMEPHIFNSLTISLYLIGMYDRYKRTKTISEIIGLLTKERGLLDTVALYIRKGWYNLKKKIDKHTDEEITANLYRKLYNPLNIKNLRVWQYEPTIVSTILDLSVPAYWQNGVYMFPPYNLLPFDDGDLIDLKDDSNSSINATPSVSRRTSIASAATSLVFSEHSTTAELKHGTCIYDDRKTNGRCGAACVAYWLKIDIKKIHPLNDWWDADDFKTSAAKHRFNAIIHTDTSVGMQYESVLIDLKLPTIKVLLQDQHWYVINCPHELYTYSIGNYADLRLSEKHLYINCANHDLTDGSGQAAAFREKFPGYDKNITKPIDDFYFGKYDKYHYCCAVANNERENKDKWLTNEKYEKISNEIFKYCEENELMAIMPLLGTAIYGCSLCCFKTHFTKNRMAMSFRDEQQQIAYNRTKPCNHYRAAEVPTGGYHKIVDLISPSIAQGKYDPSSYDQILPKFTPDRMSMKAEDFFKYCKDNSTPQLFFEVSYAPGDFAKFAIDNNINYFGAIYDGQNAFKKKYDLPDGKFVCTWKEPKVLIAALQAMNRDMTIINDTPCNNNDAAMATHDSILRFITSSKNNNVYVTKWMCYVEKHSENQTSKFLATLKNYDVNIWVNDHSNPISSEAYITIRTRKNKEPSSDTVNNDDICQRLDQINLNKQEQSVCNCNAFDSNYFDFEYKVELSKTSMVKFVESLNKDDWLVKRSIKLDAFGHNPAYLYRAKLGVAGSAKSRSVLKKICNKCSLIIAPYRKPVDQFNDTIAGCAITYIKAIELLKNDKFKFKQIFVDEAFSINPAFIALYRELAKCDVYLLGDPNQIDDRDYNQIEAKLVPIKSGKYLCTSFRSPKSIEPYIKPFIPTYRCADKNELGEIKISDKITENVPVLCHTQTTMAALKLKHPKNLINTVNGSMGCTYRDVQLYIADYNDIHESDRHTFAYVGITRHTHKLTIISNDESEAIKYLRSLEGHQSRAPVIATQSVEKDLIITKPETSVEIDIPFYQLGDNVLKCLNEEINVGDGITKPIKSTRGSVASYNILGTKMDDAISTFAVPPFNDNIVVSVPDFKPVDDRDKTCTSEYVDVAVVQGILDRVFTPANTMVSDDYIGYRDNVIREVKGDTKLSMSANVHRSNDLKLTGGKMANKNYVRMQLGKDSKAMLDTAIHRYCSLGNKQPAYKWEVYFKGLMTFMEPEFTNVRQQSSEQIWSSIKSYLTNLSVKMGYAMVNSDRTLNKIHNHIVKNLNINASNKYESAFYAAAMSTEGHQREFRSVINDAYQNFKKGNTGYASRIYEDFIHTILSDETLINAEFFKGFAELNSDWYEKKNFLISFCMKNQPKVNNSLYFDIGDKVGQGISAWSKMLNIIMSSVMKTFERDFRDHLKPNVYIATDMSDRDISQLVACYGKLYNDGTLSYINGDASEFDSSQNEATTIMTAMAMRSAGCCDAAIQVMINMREHYRCNANVNNANESGRLMFEVDWVMTSGALFTLWGNTIVIMAIMGMCYNFRGLKLCMFKGDDSHIVCENYSVRMISNRLAADVMGHKLKIDTERISEFIANIITPFGFYPDVIRRTARTIGRVCTNADHWDEIRLSIADSLSVVLYPNLLKLQHSIAGEYYRLHGVDITDQDVELLYRFLRRCAFDNRYKPKINKNYGIIDVDLSEEHEQVQMPDEDDIRELKN